MGNTAYEGTRVRMYESERNRISNIERPTLNVEVTRLSAEDGITTDQHDHWQRTTGPRTTDRRRPNSSETRENIQGSSFRVGPAAGL